jgi:hypothetical protein
MVTDGEADRFFMELMRLCFEELQNEDSEKSEQTDTSSASTASSKTPSRKKQVLTK